MDIKDFDFDVILGGMVQLVGLNLKNARGGCEHHFEWLSSFLEKAKQQVGGATEEFKMPKTPARKKTRQQKKRLLNEDDGNKPTTSDVPTKKGKLSHEEEEPKESLDGRPRRQASCAAKSKIQHSLKMFNLHQKLRRPSGEHDTSESEPMECGSPLASTSRKGIIKNESSTPPRTKESIEKDSKHIQHKVNFAEENDRIRGSCESGVEPLEPSLTEVEAKTAEPVVEAKEAPKRGRPGRKAKKVEETVEQLIPKPEIVAEEIVEERPPTPEVAVPKKKTRKVRKPEEKVVEVAPASPQVSRLQKTRNSASTTSVAKNSPRAEKTPSKTLPRNMQFNSPTASSPVRKMFTPKLVFSPFKPSSVKTKVEAFEAALGAPPAALPNPKALQSVLPEARILVKRLTNEDLKDAGINVDSPKRKPSKVPDAKRGTFVMDPPENSKMPAERKSVVQMLARKSLDKAKLLALAAARNKVLNSVSSESSESPNIHVNRNAANIMSKFRFTNGSSGSSSSSLNRHVAMTQGKTLSNVVTGVGTFTGAKLHAPLTAKPSEDEELKRKDLELKRLKEKEEEVARKREELIKAKAEEQKRKHDARAKRAMEQRAMRAKQMDEEQKQKLESKEEKSAQQKIKLLAESQEKAERVRAVLLQKQHEAEVRRKAEELQKQREWEEEQAELQRQLAAKKEQEELAKLKQAEEKAKPAPAGPSKLNTTVTLQSCPSNNYQITPVRVTKMGKIVNPDNYDIADMRSDDSTDDDSRPKKVIPNWARSINLKGALAEQARGAIDSDRIFPAEVLLVDPDLNEIFKIKRARFDKRTSSAVWRTPPANYL